MRDAYPEFRGGLSNSCSPDDPRPILRNQPSNFVFPAAGLLPIRLGDLGTAVTSPPVAAAHARQTRDLCGASRNLSRIR